MWGRGLGGAEMGLVGLTEELVRLGNEVHVWNTPIDGEGVYNGVSYHDVNSFDFYAPYDIFICFRNPFAEFPYINAKVKGWFSTDQRTCGDYALDIRPFSDINVTISPYHRQYHIDNYGFDPDKIVSIDLGVRVGDYAKNVEKVRNRLLYCSVPSRGLSYLVPIFQQIKQKYSDAELFILGDFSMWGEGIGKHDESFRRMFDGIDGVHYAGKLPREQLVELQLSSDLMVYPNAPSPSAYEELFSVSTAECQVAGAVPITSGFGGLQTTVINPTLSLVTDMWNKPLHPSDSRYGQKFVDMVVDLLNNRERLTTIQQSISTRARFRFSWTHIANQWLDVIESVKQNKGGIAY